MNSSIKLRGKGKNLNLKVAIAQYGTMKIAMFRQFCILESQNVF